MGIQLSNKLRRYKTGLSIVLLITLLYHCIDQYGFREYHLRYSHTNTTGQCSLPYHDPFDKSIMEYFYRVEPLVCDSYPDPVFVDRNGYLRYNISVKKDLGIEICVYSKIKRNGDYDVNFLPARRLNNSLYISSEGIKVECMNENGRQMYHKIFYNIDYKKIVKENNIRNETKDHLSVLIFGIDSLSKLSAYRKLPKMINYLQESLHAYIFKGYTKTAENSFPNIHALLTGNKEKKEVYYANKTADSLPFLWKDFTKAEYVTMFAEDCPHMSIFNTVTRGFEEQPVHHYLRPIYLAMDKVSPYMHSSQRRFSYFKSIFKSNSEFCYGNKPKHQIQIDYFKRFLQAYRNKRKFAFSWHTGISHNNPNYLDYGDEDFVQFLMWIKRENFLNNAILIVMGDHGSNFNAIRNTPIGRIEERMPLFAMVIPEHLKRKYPLLDETLTINAERLASHFDVYKTIKDVLHNSFMPSRSESTGIGISLFREIPKNRTCFDAGIPDWYCPCYVRIPTTVSAKKVIKTAHAVVGKINEILSGVKNLCNTLKLARIENAEIVQSTFVPVTRMKSLKQYFFQPQTTKDEQYSLQISTFPGYGLFEAMALYKSDDTVEITEYISRSNKYGNQSACVSQKKYKPYCLCYSSSH